MVTIGKDVPTPPKWLYRFQVPKRPIWLCSLLHKDFDYHSNYKACQIEVSLKKILQSIDQHNQYFYPSNLSKCAISILIVWPESSDEAHREAPQWMLNG